MAITLDSSGRAEHRSPSPKPPAAPSPAPISAPSPAPVTLAGGLRFVAVRADLMPAEVIRTRQADQMRRRVLVGLAAVVAALALAFGFSWWQTHAANSNLAKLQQQSDSLTAQTRQYGPLVDAQARTASIHSQLQRLMVGDLSWRQMLTTLRTQAPAGVGLTQVSGTITTGAAGTNGTTDATGGYNALGSGQQAVGTLTLTGAARDKKSVADYADKLGGVKGLADPFPTSVTTAASKVTFTMTLIITSDALGGRYAAPSSTTSGATTAPATTGGN